MFKPLAKYFLKQHLRKNVRKPSLVHGDLIGSIAVVGLYDMEREGFNVINGYVKELRQRGIKTVDFYVGFKAKKELELYQGSLKDHPFHRSSFSWLGKVSSSDLDSVESKSYDLLIDLSGGEMFEADMLVGKIKAKWKAGAKSDIRAYLLDFMIDMKADKDVRNLIHHLDNYLMNFNKMNAA